MTINQNKITVQITILKAYNKKKFKISKFKKKDKDKSKKDQNR